MNPFSPRPPTHEALDLAQLVDLSEQLMEQSAGGTLTADDVASVADREGVALHVAWIAAGLHPMLQVARRHEVAFAICTGRCQLWGSGEVVAGVLKLRADRMASGQRGFDIVPRQCLNRCHDAPMAFAMTEDGAVGLPRASLDEVIATLGELDDMRSLNEPRDER